MPEHEYEPEPEWVMEPEPAMEPGRASDPVMLLPAALVLGGIGLLVFSTMTMSGPLLALAFTVLLLGGAAFLVAPFVSLARHRRHR